MDSYQQCKSEETPGMSLLDLPIEVVSVIVQKLCLEDLLTFSSTCSAYRVFRWDWSVWDTLTQRNFSVPLRKPVLTYEMDSLQYQCRGQQYHPYPTIKIPRSNISEAPRHDGIRSLGTQSLDTDADPYHRFREISQEFPIFYLVCFHTCGGWYCDDDHITLDIESVDEYIDYIRSHHNLYLGDLEIHKYRGANGVYEVSKLIMPTREDEYEYEKRYWVPASGLNHHHHNRMDIRDVRYIGYFFISPFVDYGLTITHKLLNRFKRSLSIEPIRTGFLSLMVAKSEEITLCDRDYFEHYCLPMCQKIYKHIIPPHAQRYLDCLLKVMRKQANYTI